MIRFACRWLFRLGLLSAIVLTGLVLARDILLRAWLPYRIRTVTGLEARVDAIRTQPLAGSVTLTGLRIYDSPEFGGGTLLDMPHLHVELDTSAIRRRKIGLTLARVNVAEFNVVRNREGRTNVIEVISRVQERASIVEQGILAHPGLEFSGIKTLDLSVGMVRFLNLGNPSRNREVNARLTNQVVRNVSSAADLTPVILRVVFRELNESLQPKRHRERQ